MQSLSFLFESCGLSFPIPDSILKIIVEFGMSFTHMCPNFLRHLLALLVRAREEGLSFGLDELCHLCLMKQNKQSLGTFLISPRPSRQIIKRIPYGDEKWQE